ncbi:MAG: hypothetical protein M3P44_06065 [Actinomycetota bacterium]|nr:hypothetical protein [Actinomycetota bacterium]
MRCAEVDLGALANGRARGFLDACRVADRAAEEALEAASVVAAEYGGAVLRVHCGIAEALHPAADLRAAGAG